MPSNIGPITSHISIQHSTAGPGNYAQVLGVSNRQMRLLCIQAEMVQKRLVNTPHTRKTPCCEHTDGLLDWVSSETASQLFDRNTIPNVGNSTQHDSE